MGTNKSFWREILSGTNTTSSKRLVTLIISLHFILASFATLFFAFYVIFYLPKGRIEPELIALLKEVLEYDFYIILSGLGFITVEGTASILMERVKAKYSYLNNPYMMGANPYQNPYTEAAPDEQGPVNPDTPPQ